MATKPVDIPMTLRDRVTATLAKINKRTLDYKKNMKDLKRDAKDTWETIGSATKVGAAAAIAAIGGLATAGIKYNATIEQSAASFKILLGSASAANDMVSQLQSIAVNSPFEFTGLQNSAKTMLGMGIQANNIIPYMNTLGDAVAAVGGNTETINGIALALGQIQAKGKISAEEMNQLAERGIPAWQILSKQMGKPASELMKMSQNGQLFADKTLPLIMKGLDERFGGSMKEMSKTFTYGLANMRESLQMILGKITAPLFSIIGADLAGLNEKLDKMNKDGSLQQWIDKASEAFVGLYNTIKTIGIVVYDVGKFFVNNWSWISPIIYGIVGALVAYKTIMIAAKIYTYAVTVALYAQTVAQIGLNTAIRANPMGWLIGLIGLLIAAGVLLVKNFETVKLVMMNVWNVLVGAAEWGVNAYLTYANFMLSVYKFAFDSIEFAGKSIWNGILSAGQAGINGFIGLIEKMIDKSLEGINGLIRGANKASNALGFGDVANELSFGGLGRVDFSGAKANNAAPKWDNKQWIPAVDFSAAQFSDSAISAQQKKANAQQAKNKAKDDKKIDDLTDAINSNTDATTYNTSATNSNTATLKGNKSAMDIVDGLFGRIERGLRTT